MKDKKPADQMQVVAGVIGADPGANGVWLEEVADELTLNRWGQFPFWTVEEGVAFSLRRDPSKFRWKSLQQYSDSSSFAQEFKWRLEQARRAVEFGQLQDRNEPAHFMRWAINSNVSLDDHVAGIELVRRIIRENDRLMTEYHSLTHPISLDFLDTELPAAKANRDTELGERERNSLLKIVIGMAIGGYAHQPKQSRSTTAKEIANDVESTGLRVDEDTVRKYLRQAAELLPADRTPISKDEGNKKV